MKKLILVVILMIGLTTLLSACSEPSYYLSDQDIYTAVVQPFDPNQDEDDNGDTFVRLALQDKAKNANMTPGSLMYYKASKSEIDNLEKAKNVWLIIGKYETVDTDNKATQEYDIDALFTSEQNAQEAFGRVEQVIPTKISKKVERNNEFYVHLVLEEKNGVNVNFYPFHVSKDVYDTLKVDSYYNIKVQFSGQNIKVLSIQDPIQKDVYDKYMTEQQTAK